MAQRIGEYLEVGNSSGKKVIKCRKCGHVFCPVTENYKEYALVSEVPLTKLGSMYSDTDRFIFREFYCPGCATLLCVEMTVKDLPCIWDTQLV